MVRQSHCKNILPLAASHIIPFDIFKPQILAKDRYTSNKIVDCYWKLNVNQFCVCGWISGATADVEQPQKFLRLDQLSDNYFIYQSLFLFRQHLPSSCKQNKCSILLVFKFFFESFAILKKMFILFWRYITIDLRCF